MKIIIDTIYKKMEFCLDEVNTNTDLTDEELIIYQTAYKTYIDVLCTINSNSIDDEISSHIIKKRNELKKYCLEKGYK